MTLSYSDVDKAERARRLRGLLLEEKELLEAARKLAVEICATASGVEDCEDGLVQEMGELLQHAADVRELGLQLCAVRAEMAALEGPI